MTWTEKDGANALEKMMLRASCRNFDSKEIPEDILRNVLNTGICAASGGNLQPLSIVVITDPDEKKRLCEACGGQKFIEQAPVNLLFLLDWHKMSVYAENQDAAFNCNDSFMHFLIGLEDVICAAQSIETAAHFMGIGSCYVGTTNHCGDVLVEMFGLPKLTYPVVMLSMGYPSADLSVRKKLAYDIMVFKDKYPDLSKEYICEKFEEKYAGQAMRLPGSEQHRSELLQRFRKALLTTYPPEKTDEIVKAADEAGALNETQRRFGLHYNAREMSELGVEIINKLKNQGLTPFHD